MIKRIALAIIFLIQLVACDNRSDIKQFSAEELNLRLNSDNAILLIDVRSEEEYEAGFIPGAINIPVYKFKSGIPDLVAGKEKEIIVYCHSGPRAYFVQEKLSDAGYHKVYDLQGHFSDWKKKGFPVQG